MHPTICTIGPFTIYSYGLLLAIAFLVSSSLAAKEAGRQGIAKDLIINLSFLVLICGIAGARVFYVIENLSYYLKNPIEVIMLSRGGLSVFGGLISGVIIAVIYLKRKKQSVYKVLDIIVPFVALAQSIGRIGCLLNGCCYGRVSEFGIYFKTHDEFLIPTQLYSSLMLIIMFVALRFLQERKHKEGQVLFSYLLFYSFGRFFIEFWRADNARVFMNLTLFQLLSIVIFFISSLKLGIIYKNR